MWGAYQATLGAGVVSLGTEAPGSQIRWESDGKENSVSRGHVIHRAESKFTKTKEMR